MIFSAFTECLLAPLERVHTYYYMINLIVDLNSFSSSLDCTLGCGTLNYLVIMEKPALFISQCGTKSWHPPRHAVPSPNGRNFSQTHQNPQAQSFFLKKYNSVDQSCKRVIIKLTLEKFYKSLRSWIIGFANFTCLQILTHLITNLFPEYYHLPVPCTWW